MLAGCYTRDEPSATPTVDVGDRATFTFGTIDGQEFSSDTTRGHSTVLLFVTTYDLPSQAEAQLLRDALATHRPSVNAAVIMMEAPRAAELSRVWAESVGWKLPVAMATPALMAGESQLGRINGVPTLLVLDRRGRVVARHEGAATREEIAAALRRSDRP